MKNFSISHSNHEDIEILLLSGELDAHTAGTLEDSLKKLINEKRLKIVVNCNSLEYIASAGLGVFMAYIEDVRTMGGDIKLTNMNERVYHVFDLLGFPSLYDILHDQKEAISRFQSA